MEDISGTPEHAEKIQTDIQKLREQNDEIISDWLNNMIENGGDLYDFINPTYTVPEIDLQGNGAVLKLYYRNRGTANAEIDRYRLVYCEYIEVQQRDDGTNMFYCRNPVSMETYNLKGELQNTYDLNGDSVYACSQIKVGDNFSISGDCRRLEDGSIIDTAGEAIPVIGEADGTQVTPDMLNPDGTVTIDGTTYSPSDYIDWEKFKDPAIIDLLNQILKALENTPVIAEQDDLIIDADNIEIDVPEELSDFTVPVGIANVFPFCLPWDFVRGIKMLLAEPEVPVFKTEIDLTDFCGFDLGVIPFEVSFEKIA